MPLALEGNLTGLLSGREANLRPMGGELHSCPIPLSRGITLDLE